MTTFLLLCVSHVFGDYVLQWNTMAREKANDMKLFVWHCIIYAACMASVFLYAPFCEALVPWLLISVSHACIDKIRCILLVFNQDSKRTPFRKNIRELQYFCYDQAIHLLFILISCWFILRFHQGCFHRFITQYPVLRSVLGYTAVFCFIWKPVQILISKVFALFSEQNTDDEHVNAGTIIGILERVIVVVLVLMKAAAAIGFVLTAKSIARIKQLENDDNFIERYLVGTLLSVASAIAAVLLLSRFYPYI